MFLFVFKNLKLINDNQLKTTTLILATFSSIYYIYSLCLLLYIFSRFHFFYKEKTEN